MTNYVTTNVTSSKEVIFSLLDESGKVNFYNIVKFPGKVIGDKLKMNNMSMAMFIIDIKDIIFNEEQREIAKNLISINHKSYDMKNLDQEDFEQIIDMIKNFRECRYFNEKEFYLNELGCDPYFYNTIVHTDDDKKFKLTFETIWTAPIDLLKKLSSKFKDTEIEFHFEDPLMSRYKGSGTLLNGDYLKRSFEDDIL